MGINFRQNLLLKGVIVCECKINLVKGRWYDKGYDYVHK